MRRRELVLGLGGAVLIGPFAAGAQQKTSPLIGILGIATAAVYVPWLAAFRRGLADTGYIEGQNLSIEYRWAEIASIGCRRSPPNSSAVTST